MSHRREDCKNRDSCYKHVKYLKSKDIKTKNIEACSLEACKGSIRKLESTDANITNFSSNKIETYSLMSQVGNVTDLTVETINGFAPTTPCDLPILDSSVGEYQLVEKTQEQPPNPNPVLYNQEVFDQLWEFALLRLNADAAPGLKVALQCGRLREKYYQDQAGCVICPPNQLVDCHPQPDGECLCDFCPEGNCPSINNYIGAIQTINPINFVKCTNSDEVKSRILSAINYNLNVVNFAEDLSQRVVSVMIHYSYTGSTSGHPVDIANKQFQYTYDKFFGEKFAGTFLIPNTIIENYKNNNLLFQVVIYIEEDVAFLSVGQAMVSANYLESTSINTNQLVVSGAINQFAAAGTSALQWVTYDNINTGSLEPVRDLQFYDSGNSNGTYCLCRGYNGVKIGPGFTPLFSNPAGPANTAVKSRWTGTNPAVSGDSFIVGGAYLWTFEEQGDPITTQTVSDAARIIVAPEINPPQSLITRLNGLTQPFSNENSIFTTKKSELMTILNNETIIWYDGSDIYTRPNDDSIGNNRSIFTGNGVIDLVNYNEELYFAQNVGSQAFVYKRVGNNNVVIGTFSGNIYQLGLIDVPSVGTRLGISGSIPTRLAYYEGTWITLISNIGGEIYAFDREYFVMQATPPETVLDGKKSYLYKLTSNTVDSFTKLSADNQPIVILANNVLILPARTRIKVGPKVENGTITDGLFMYGYFVCAVTDSNGQFVLSGIRNFGLFNGQI